VSGRTASAYTEYAKDYPVAALSLRVALSNGLDVSHQPISTHQMLSLLSVPLMRLGEYGVMLAPIEGDLDDICRKTMGSVMRSLDRVFRKCRAIAIPAMYSK
jgi:hypothetical protein